MPTDEIPKIKRAPHISEAAQQIAEFAADLVAIGYEDGEIGIAVEAFAARTITHYRDVHCAPSTTHHVGTGPSKTLTIATKETTDSGGGPKLIDRVDVVFERVAYLAKQGKSHLKCDDTDDPARVDGESVSSLQYILIGLGAEIGVTGRFDTDTEEALKQLTGESDYWSRPAVADKEHRTDLAYLASLYIGQLIEGRS